MAKILYISPEHISGNLTLFQQGHRRRGHECRFVTFFSSSSGFPEDICLHLPLMPDSGWVKFWKKRIYRSRPEMQGRKERSGCPPVWRPSTAGEALLFWLRDRLLAPKINAAVRRYELDRFDLYHLDQGLDFFRDGRFTLRMKSRGAYVTCFYHGTDLRNRGVIPEINAVSDLNLTSELDLLDKHPAIRYLHLPFDVQRFRIRTAENRPLVIGHACRGREARHFKGTDRIIQVVSELEKSHGIRFDLVEGVPHEECLHRKADWDIAVDQIADVGGWGYGMNSLETLSMGIPTCTRMNDRCAAFFADHPFVNVNSENLKSELIKLIEKPDYRRRKGVEGREWVMKRHSLESVMDELYAHYAAAGIQLDDK